MDGCSWPVVSGQLLRDGTVLLAGGDGPGDPMLASAELYEPRSGRWTKAASMSGPRVESAVTVLTNGNVFVVGGFAVPGEPLLPTAEAFDSQSGAWSSAGAMHTGSFDLTATVLPNGEVLVAGGLVAEGVGVTSSAELYKPAP
jgi:N-acetylneuraminic acid mutarotase